jgi:hypothetical protein
MPIKQSFRGHQHARCTETALYSSTLDESLLERMKVLGVSQAARCRNCCPVSLHSQDETGQSWLSVQQHRTGATVTLATSQFHVPLMQIVSQ